MDIEKIKCISCGEDEFDIFMEDELTVKGEKYTCQNCHLIHHFDNPIKIKDGKFFGNFRLTYDWTKKPMTPIQKNS